MLHAVCSYTVIIGADHAIEQPKIKLIMQQTEKKQEIFLNSI